MSFNLRQMLCSFLTFISNRCAFSLSHQSLSKFIIPLHRWFSQIPRTHKIRTYSTHTSNKILSKKDVSRSIYILKINRSFLRVFDQIFRSGHVKSNTLLLLIVQICKWVRRNNGFLVSPVVVPEKIAVFL